MKAVGKPRRLHELGRIFHRQHEREPGWQSCGVNRGRKSNVLVGELADHGSSLSLYAALVLRIEWWPGGLDGDSGALLFQSGSY